MNQEEMLTRVADVVSDVLDIEADNVTAELGHETCEEWDSLAQISLLVSVENEFGVKFDAKDMAALNSVKAIMEALERIGAE